MLKTNLQANPNSTLTSKIQFSIFEAKKSVVIGLEMSRLLIGFSVLDFVGRDGGNAVIRCTKISNEYIFTSTY